MKMKFSIVALLAAAVLLAQIPVAAANGFSDVPAGNQYYTAITFLQDRGIVSGYPDGTFKPDQAVNRVETLKIIVGGLVADIVDATGTGGFKDTIADAWYAKYLLKAQVLAIVQGYPDGTFKPTQTVNLAENLKILLKTEKVDPTAITVTSDPYADVPMTEWYAPYMQYAKDHNLIDADSLNKVYPAQGMTRGKLAEMLYRLIYIHENKLDKFVSPSQQPQQTQQTQTTPPVTTDVSISNFSFQPSSETITAGTTVRWTNLDPTLHQIVSDDGLFQSSGLSTNEAFSFTFSTPGTYKYHCAIHPYMTGTITVNAGTT